MSNRQTNRIFCAHFAFEISKIYPNYYKISKNHNKMYKYVNFIENFRVICREITRLQAITYACILIIVLCPPWARPWCVLWRVRNLYVYTLYTFLCIILCQEINFVSKWVFQWNVLWLNFLQRLDTLLCFFKYF